MYDLFNPFPDSKNPLEYYKAKNDFSKIPGLTYLPNFISNLDEIQFLKIINSLPWLSDIKRRVQHYGFKYDYKARSIDYSMYLGALPLWALDLAKRLYHEKLIELLPDQMIVNEYLPGQGIANHIDCEPCFGETIISISLGSHCIMDFINKRTNAKIEILLEPCSLVAISGEARHLWSHGIAQRKTDLYQGQLINRRLRVSMTFRKVVLK